MNLPRLSISCLAVVTVGLLCIGCDSTEEPDGPFYVAFAKEVKINQTGSQLACGGNPEYSLGHPTYVATFASVDGATSYTGRILRKDDSYASQMALTSLTDEGNGNMKYSLGVGSIVVFLTCNQTDAATEQQNRLDYLDTVGHQGVEITPVF